jgi:hypothetical protein
MTSTDNRSRLTIDQRGAWKLYAGAGWPPAGWTMHGTVTRGIGDTGALALSPAGVYCQVNAGAVRSLEQRKVVAALTPKVNVVQLVDQRWAAAIVRGDDVRSYLISDLGLHTATAAADTARRDLDAIDIDALPRLAISHAANGRRMYSPASN